jgi:hypothetical protein
METDDRADKRFIEDARENFGDDGEILTVREACEAYYMSGFADEESGDVEAPTGHFYRVGRYLVTTDSQGFHSWDRYATERDAETAFGDADCEYAEWLGEED